MTNLTVGGVSNAAANLTVQPAANAVTASTNSMSTATTGQQAASATTPNDGGVRVPTISDAQSLRNSFLTVELNSMSNFGGDSSAASGVQDSAADPMSTLLGGSGQASTASDPQSILNSFLTTELNSMTNASSDSSADGGGVTDSLSTVLASPATDGKLAGSLTTLSGADQNSTLNNSVMAAISNLYSQS
jgi:hypothetical protein